MSDIDIVVKMLEEKQGLQKSGVPRIAALEAALKRDVTSAERDSLYEEALKVLKSKKDAKIVKQAMPQGIAVIKSGLGSW